jgi:glutamate-1-semialdehyde 2,1-aminomutase
MSTQAVPRTSEEERYLSRTAASRRYFVEARKYLPGGDSRSTLFYHPYPAVMARGEGCVLFDLDGNRLLDFTGNHSSLPHGYGHPAIIAAVDEQLRKGTAFPGASDPQLHFARLLCQRIPSIEQVRFTTSGTEATLNAVRAARAFTGRARIAKVEGGYHGTADEILAGIHGEAAVILPFNDIERARSILDTLGDDIAAVLVEPVLGSAGMIPADRGYLDMLRDVTRRHGIVLVFDEVVSLRVAPGGAQEYFGVTPDLTCLGKLIGGGFPLGAFGGRSDIMALFDPSHGQPAVPHPGSHNANPISMVAGATTLELLTPVVIDRMNRRAEELRQDIADAFAEVGTPAQITGLGSLFAVHLTPHPVRSYRDTLSADPELRHRLFLGLFNEGILIDPRGVGNLSTAVGDQEVTQFSAALRRVLSRVAA